VEVSVEPSLVVPDREEFETVRAGRPLRLDARELAAIFAGGFVGAVARAELVAALPAHLGSWPWATFIANVVGAFLLGYFTTRLQERLPVSAYRRPLLGTGLCGGLTTFSTFQIELLRMLDSGRVGLAVAYALTSLAAGFLAVLLATNLVRRARWSG
jgi:fluoride exporter